MHNVSVSIGSPEQAIAAPWAALIKRAPANAFMHPAGLRAAQATGFADIKMLLAWERDAEPARLVGVWAFQRNHITPFGPSFLAAPPHDYAFVANPVIDPEFIEPTVAAFFEAIEREPSLPKVIRLRYLDGNDPSVAFIMRALKSRGAGILSLSESERPYVTKEFGVKHTGSTRKKLRQDWNRLIALGAVDIVNDRAHDAVPHAFETYLTMETASWKGATGTALLCDEEDAIFVRRMIAELAADGSASVALLRVDGRPIAAQVLLYCGTTAYTWKTTFDAAFSKFSPGALLVDKITEQLFAGAGIEAIESCSPEGGFMNQLWEGRRATIDLLADVSAKPSLAFHALVAHARGYALLREWRNQLRAMPSPAQAWRNRAAASR
jgi:CelD/BcsL family acetyltransferase involved in cellulose biosynthesis